jgi:glutamate dehydrogenase (NAD(P)+)
LGILAFKLLQRLGRFPKNTRAAVQGFGNVGTHAAKLLHESDIKVVAVSDLSGGYYNPEGLDIPGALKHVMQHHSLQGFTKAERITNEELLGLDIEMLVPAALGNVINASNVHQIKAQIIVEGANGPVAPEADDVLEANNVVVLPDILANAGGVTVSYFEWVQNRQYYHWDLNRVRQSLDNVLSTAFEDVWQMSCEHKVSLRTAAFMIGIDRVRRATELSGY